MMFVLGMLAGVALTLFVIWLAAIINWLRADHDRS